MKRIILFFVIFTGVVFEFTAFAVHPVVRNFNRKLSKAGAQNWDIIQYKNDWMYFANNSGLLEYDGNRWMVYPIQNYTNVRSIYYDEISERIYAGAFNEFGYYARNKSGVLRYFSLIKKLKNVDKDFTEIWNIHKTENLYFFQADNDVFRFDGNKVKRFGFDDKINCSAVVHNSLFVSSYKYGVTFLNGDIFLPFPNSDILKNKKICAILPYQQNKILFVTDFNGIYVFNGEKVEPFKTDIDEFLIQNQVFCATIKNDQLAVGTVRNGLVVKNLNDNSTIYSNTQSGLQNNTILSLSFDRLGNLWLGLDKGISYVMINSPIYDLFGNSNLLGAGYASLVRGNNLYLGTNQGLYLTNYPIENTFQTTNVQLINKVQGQVWSLEQIDNTLFCGSDHGAFVVNDNQVEQIAGLSGTWGFKAMHSKPDCIIGSSYQGFFVLKKNGAKWQFSNYIKGFSESGGMYEEDAEGKIWFSHWMKGIYRLTLNEQLDSVVKIDYYGVEKGFPSTHNNTLYRFNNQIYFSTENGFYQYNPKKNRVEKSLLFESLFGVPRHSVKFYTSPNNDLWCISGTQIKMAFNRNKGKYQLDSASFFSLKDKLVPGFEHLSFMNDTSIIIATEDGFSLINTKKLAQKTELFKVAIRNVYVTNERDSIVNGYVQTQDKKNIPEFDSKNNSVRFEFVGTEYRNDNSMLYSYLLENYDTEWSEFSTVNTKEFTKLGTGTYTFKVRAKNLYNSQVVETSYKFTILPPWYKSTAALIVYALFLLVGFYLLIRYITFRSEQGAREMEAKKELEMQEQEKRYKADAKEKEKEIISLKNQKLQYELRHKSQDLASSTMNLIRKNEILFEINNKLDKIGNEILDKEDSNAIVRKIRKMQDEIKVNIEHDNNWKKFQENFDLVYENYLKRLGEQFPVLTVSDKKLCAYLKMDLSSKDIAPLLNMSFRSVEMSRYRLRKKLNLDRDVNLTEFLQNF